MSFGDCADDNMDTESSLDAQADSGADSEEAEESTLFYGSVIEFFEKYLRKVYVRRITPGGLVWDERWWEIDEALVRIESLWRAWEFLRHDSATGTSVWFRDHLDHHMPVLMSPDGPFAGSEAKNKRGEPLPHEAPREGLFPDVRTSD